MTRRRWILVAIGAVLVLGGAGYLFLRAGSTPITADEAVERFRDRATPRPSPEPSAPEPGVYVYATTGGDEISVAGGSHAYPAETTITISPEGCGYRQRWDALAERWEERVICPEGEGDLLLSTRAYHEFFGQGDERRFTCEDDTLYRLAADAVPGTTWTGRCASGERGHAERGHVVGPETLEVADERVETIHYRVDVEITGNETGMTSVDRWIDPRTGLLVRERSSTASDSEQAFGTVRYEETYEIRLTSLEPRR